MAEQPNLTERDYEQLSAYLDGMLADSERAQLEQRLAQEPTLRRELDALRDAVALVKSLPKLKAPRNFTLTPAMVAQPTEAPRTQSKAVPFPIVSLLSAAAAFVLIALGIVLFVGGGDDADTMPSSVALSVEDRAADEAEETDFDDQQAAMPPASVQLTSSPANERDSTTLNDDVGADPAALNAVPTLNVQTTQMAEAEIQQESVLATAEARASDLDTMAVVASPSPMLNQQTMPQTATALSNLRIQPSPMPTQDIAAGDADDGAMPESADFAEEAMESEAPVDDAMAAGLAEADAVDEEAESGEVAPAIPQTGGGPGGPGQAAAAPTGTVIARFISTPSPTPTPTATVTSSPVPTATSSPTPFPTATPEPTLVPEVAEAQPEPLPQEQGEGAGATEQAQPVETTATDDQTLPLVLIALGLVALGFSILTFLRSRQKRANP